MKLPLPSLAFAAAISLSAVSAASAEPDKETKAALKESSDAAKRMDLNAPRLAQVLRDDDDDEDSEPSPKSSASPRKLTTSANPPALPDWTPPVPQFKTDGPVAKKKIDGEEKIAQTGTSPLTPAELGDAWETEKTARFSRARNNLSINAKITVTVTLSTFDEPKEEVHLEAVRGPKDKITHVTIYSPLPKAGKGK